MIHGSVFPTDHHGRHRCCEIYHTDVRQTTFYNNLQVPVATKPVQEPHLVCVLIKSVNQTPKGNYQTEVTPKKSVFLAGRRVIGRVSSSARNTLQSSYSLAVFFSESFFVA